MAKKTAAPAKPAESKRQEQRRIIGDLVDEYNDLILEHEVKGVPPITSFSSLEDGKKRLAVLKALIATAAKKKASTAAAIPVKKELTDKDKKALAAMDNFDKLDDDDPPTKKATDKAVPKPTGKGTKRTKPAKAATKPYETTKATKATSKPAAKPATKPAAKPATKPAAKPAAKPATKATKADKKASKKAGKTAKKEAKAAKKTKSDPKRFRPVIVGKEIFRKIVCEPNKGKPNATRKEFVAACVKKGIKESTAGRIWTVSTEHLRD